ncbi:MAG: HEAT repeat domain-containing protein [Endomicrobiia bacterium]
MKFNMPLSFFKKGSKITIGQKTSQSTQSVSGELHPPISQQAETELNLKTVDALIKSLSEKDPFVRAIGCEVLGKMREKKALRQIMMLLKDPSKYVREKAAISLGQIGDKKAVPVLVEVLEKDEAEEVRVTIAGVLGHLRDKVAVPVLIKTLEDPSPTARMKSAISLGLIGDPSAIPALYRVLKDTHELVRKYACEALGNIGRPAIPALLMALKDEQVRAHAAQVLTKIK